MPVVVTEDVDQATETYDTAIFGSMAADGPDRSLRIEDLEDGGDSFISNTEFYNSALFPFDNTIKVQE